MGLLYWLTGASGKGAGWLRVMTRCCTTGGCTILCWAGWMTTGRLFRVVTPPEMGINWLRNPCLYAWGLNTKPVWLQYKWLRNNNMLSYRYQVWSTKNSNSYVWTSSLTWNISFFSTNRLVHLLHYKRWNAIFSRYVMSFILIIILHSTLAVCNNCRQWTNGP